MSDPRVSDMTLPPADRIAAAGPGQAVPVTQEEFALIRNRAQPQPTDLDRFKALFDSVGLIYQSQDYPTGATLALHGYRPSRTVKDCGAARYYFMFDAAGKFFGHGDRE